MLNIRNFQPKLFARLSGFRSFNNSINNGIDINFISRSLSNRLTLRNSYRYRRILSTYRELVIRIRFNVSLFSKLAFNSGFIEFKAVIKGDVFFTFIGTQTNTDFMPLIIFFECSRGLAQDNFGIFVNNRSKLETFAINFVTNDEFFSQKLTRKAHITDNFNFAGAYNRTVNRLVVNIAKSEAIVNINKQIAFVFATASIGRRMATRQIFTLILNKNFRMSCITRNGKMFCNNRCKDTTSRHLNQQSTFLTKGNIIKVQFRRTASHINLVCSMVWRSYALQIARPLLYGRNLNILVQRHFCTCARSRSSRALCTTSP